mgnify:CR=1 FL=1
MNKCDINALLHRVNTCAHFKKLMADFETNKFNLIYKKGIYVYGPPGAGKTHFVISTLEQMGYDVIQYDASDVKNTIIFENIINNGMSLNNIMGSFTRTEKKIVIVMDEIDAMAAGDKGCISNIIKLIRPKKTKKQKLENTTVVPIVCIGNLHIDKKIKELLKGCFSIKLSAPPLTYMRKIIDTIMPMVLPDTAQNIAAFVNGDLRILVNIYNMYKTSPTLITDNVIDEIFQYKICNNDINQVVKHLMRSKYKISDHGTVINETDRTTVALLWHENIIDMIESKSKAVSVPFYIQQLDNICFSDYINRVTFQKQIWQFNEMSSLLKTFKNNALYHETFGQSLDNPGDIRFTKVLTKYATEYNNTNFIQKLCQALNMDTRDMLSFFIELKQSGRLEDVEGKLLEVYDIKKLDINRIYKYINNIKNPGSDSMPILDSSEVELELEPMAGNE